jgi:hypothetical protein
MTARLRPILYTLFIFSIRLEHMDCAQLYLCLSMQTAATTLIEYEGELMTPIEKARRMQGGLGHGNVTARAVTVWSHCLRSQAVTASAQRGQRLSLLSLQTALARPAQGSLKYLISLPSCTCLAASEIDTQVPSIPGNRPGCLLCTVILVDHSDQASGV